MATINLTAGRGINTSGEAKWTGVEYTATEDSQFAVHSIGAPLKPLYLFNLTPELPENIKIDGLEVQIKALVSSGTGTPVFTVQFVKDTTLARISDVKTTTAISTGLTTVTVGGSTDLWGSFLKRAEAANDYFGLLITPSGSTDRTYSIDEVVIIVHYSTTGFLTGSRSVFSKRASTNYDAGVSNPNLVPVSNGTAATNQVLAEQMNKLGDAIFSMEEVALTTPQNNNPVYVQGSTAKVYAATITITGIVSAAISGVLAYSRFYNPNNSINFTGHATTGLTSSGRSNLNIPDKNRTFNFTTISAIGWVTSGSTNTPLFVQPNFSYVSNSQGASGYHLSFAATNKNPLQNVTGDLLTDPDLPGYDTWVELPSFPGVPAGTLTVKIFGLVRYNF